MSTSSNSKKIINELIKIHLLQFDAIPMYPYCDLAVAERIEDRPVFEGEIPQ